ncbi:MAG: hypothetical protein RLZZ609_3139 [Cyanobacteriota bacterium]|jgi:hypothetical protein
MADTLSFGPANCLDQSWLTWQSDGELSPEDRQLVLERLLQADGCASAARECWVLSEQSSLAYGHSL